MGPKNPNGGHARGGGMDWLSKIFGTEHVWMAILRVPIKIDRLQDRPKTRTMIMPMAVAWIAYQKFSGPIFFGWRFCCFL